MKLRYYMRGLGIGMLVTALILTLSGNGKKRMSDEQIKARAAELGMVMQDNSVLTEPGTPVVEKIEEEMASASDVDAKDSEQTEKAKDAVPVEQFKEVAEAEDTETVEAEDKEAEEKAKAEAEEKAKAEAEEKAKAEAEEKAKAEAEEKAKAEAEKKAAEEKAKAEAEKKAAEEKAKAEAEKKAAEEKAKAEAEKKAAEEKAKEEAEKKAAEEKAKEEAEKQTANPGKVYKITVKSGSSSTAVAKQLADAGLVYSASSYDEYLCKNGYDKRICVGTFEIPAGSSDKRIAEIITRTS